MYKKKISEMHTTQYDRMVDRQDIDIVVFHKKHLKK